MTIRQPPERKPQKDLARIPTAPHFVDPRIVKVVPGRWIGSLGRFEVFPEGTVAHVLVGGVRVGVPATFGAADLQALSVCIILIDENLHADHVFLFREVRLTYQELNRRSEHTSLRRPHIVELLTGEQNEERRDMSTSRDQIRQIESDVAFSVAHTDLPD